MRLPKKEKYRYYDTPDGQDLGKKIRYLMKPFFAYGMFMGISDVCFISTPVGWFPLTERFVRVSSRPIFTPIIFATTVYMATKIRRKDDGLNHILGGAACGYYWSRYICFNPISIPLTVFVCGLLYTFKYLKLTGIEVMHDEYAIGEELDHTAVSRFNTWTWNQKIEREWLTAEEAVAKGIAIEN